mmetsp:Transcript_67701/g.201334  ORF Transcript_67701/g.201334 Transcript_67701/m.201334 type:complete len:445 (-) Transcript_67701:279-1613(-)
MSQNRDLAEFMIKVTMMRNSARKRKTRMMRTMRAMRNMRMTLPAVPLVLPLLLLLLASVSAAGVVALRMISTKDMATSTMSKTFQVIVFFSKKGQLERPHPHQQLHRKHVGEDLLHDVEKERVLICTVHPGPELRLYPDEKRVQHDHRCEEVVKGRFGDYDGDKSSSDRRGVGGAGQDPRLVRVPYGRGLGGPASCSPPVRLYGGAALFAWSLEDSRVPVQPTSGRPCRVLQLFGDDVAFPRSASPQGILGEGVHRGGTASLATLWHSAAVGLRLLSQARRGAVPFRQWILSVLPSGELCHGTVASRMVGIAPGRKLWVAALRDLTLAPWRLALRMRELDGLLGPLFQGVVVQALERSADCAQPPCSWILHLPQHHHALHPPALVVLPLLQAVFDALEALEDCLDVALVGLLFLHVAHWDLVDLVRHSAVLSLHGDRQGPGEQL